WAVRRTGCSRVDRQRRCRQLSCITPNQTSPNVVRSQAFHSASAMTGLRLLPCAQQSLGTRYFAPFQERAQSSLPRARSGSSLPQSLLSKKRNQVFPAADRPPSIHASSRRNVNPVRRLQIDSGRLRRAVTFAALSSTRG